MIYADAKIISKVIAEKLEKTILSLIPFHHIGYAKN